jgi:hypothetical protein
MLPGTDGGTDPERLELFSVRGAAARPQLLRAPASFRDLAETRADDETP